MSHYKGPTFFELMCQFLSSTEHGYDLLASKFDYTPFRTSDDILQVVQNNLKVSSTGTALDICCGTGAAIEMLQSLCHDRIVGIDFSQGMLGVAQNKFLSMHETEVKFVCGNAFDMPFVGEFDLAVCFGAFGHIPTKDESKFIDEVAKVLKPNGRFVFVTAYSPSIWSKCFWISRTFNAVMRIRNLLVKPPFIMYYLTFLLPKVKILLENHGFEVEVKKVFKEELSHFRLVIATKKPKN